MATIAAACTVMVGVVAVLSPGAGSVVPGGGVMVAALAEIVAGVTVGAVPLTSTTSTSPTPTLTPTLRLPVPEAVAHDVAADTTAQVQVTPVSCAGIESVSVAPTARDGPVLRTSMRYCTAPPAGTAAPPAGLTMVLITLSCDVAASALLSLAVLLPGVGSEISFGAVTVAVFTSGLR
ncbi:hypothetical protein NSY55_27235 [Pseudomonas aeruginosa]|nr:hypothetical protein [Pseudomonas aeruginosa]